MAAESGAQLTVSGSILRLVALVIPLGLDTFAISAALGLAGLAARDRLRVSALFMAFEAGMPLVGLSIGAVLAKGLGSSADWIAAALLVGLGIYMLVSGDDDDQVAALLSRTRGLALLGLGLGISLDELAIGFTLGLVKVPVVIAIVLIGVQAFAVAQVGFRVGSRIGESAREGAERAAAVILVVLGIAIGAMQALGLQL